MQDRFKVGTLSFCYPHLGGSGIMATRVANELALGGDGSVMISYEDAKLTEEMKMAGVSLYPAQRIESGYGFLRSTPHTETLTCKALEAIKEKELEVLHSHYAVPHAFVGNTVKDMSGISHVATIHGSDIHTMGDNPGVKATLSWALEKADGVTFVSEYLRRKCIDIYETDFGGVVIPNFVDVNKFKKSQSNEMRKKYDIPEDAVIITHASNFRPVKDTLQIGWSARRLLAEKKYRDKLFFLFIGDESAPDYIRMKQDSTYAGFENSFRFLGRQESVAPFLAESDIAVLSSYREGCPLFVLEALASSVPLVGTNIGGISGIVNHEESGLLFDQGNMDGLIENLRILIDNKDKRMAMGEKGLEVILNGYSRDVVIEQYRDIYKKVVKK
ncbi:glycosyltransferase [Candidatus Woesearchaeota archaeon]|nr:glycosyltransferase [Candidatus Woesearchaeota archaeon]